MKNHCQALTNDVNNPTYLVGKLLIDAFKDIQEEIKNEEQKTDKEILDEFKRDFGFICNTCISIKENPFVFTLDYIEIINIKFNMYEKLASEMISDSN